MQLFSSLGFASFRNLPDELGLYVSGLAGMGNARLIRKLGALVNSATHFDFTNTPKYIVQNINLHLAFLPNPCEYGHVGSEKVLMFS